LAADFPPKPPREKTRRAQATVEREILREHSPPRRGGEARSAGVVSSANRVGQSDHPVCAACGADTPPLRGGECPPLPEVWPQKACVPSRFVQLLPAGQGCHFDAADLHVITKRVS